MKKITEIDDNTIECVTDIANAILKIKHPDLSIKPWQVKVVLKAVILINAYNKVAHNR